MEKSGLYHFNQLVNAIEWTDHYPQEGIRFSDLSAAFGHPSLLALAKIVVESLCIEKGQVVVGVPTRGVIWATILSNAAKTNAVYLSKSGQGTQLPGSVPLVEAGTVYSADSTKSKFNIRTIDVDVLKSAHIIWVADDVCESGNTLINIHDAIVNLTGKEVRLLPLMTIFSSLLSTLPIIKDKLYSVIEVVDRVCYPGTRVFTRPESLLTLRGPMTSETNAPVSFERVYGPPSMTHLMLTYCQSTEGAVIGDLVWSEFDGGMPNVFFEVSSDIVFFYDANWMHTIQEGVVHALARGCSNKMTVIVPYLPQGTMERIDKEGTLATAQTSLHSLCAAMPQTKDELVKVIINDVHSTIVRFYPTDKIHYNPGQLLFNLVPEWADIVAFPDGGAYSRFGHLFTGGDKPRTLLTFSKMRHEGQRKIVLSEQTGPVPISGAKVVIVDDLTRTGGTLMETAKILRALGAIRVGACFVHSDFDPGKTIPFANSPLFDNIFCTDSNPRKARALYMANPAKVHVKNIFNYRQVKFGLESYSSTVFLASESETKLSALRKEVKSFRPWTSGIFYGPVPSQLPEQPIGHLEGKMGAENRALFLVRTYINSEIRFSLISFESAIVETAQGKYQDVAFTLLQFFGGSAVTRLYCGTQEGPFVRSFTRSGTVSAHSNPPCRNKFHGTTVGELMQKKYNLPSKDSWIGYFFDTNRETQLSKSLQNAISEVHKKSSSSM